MQFTAGHCKKLLYRGEVACLDVRMLRLICSWYTCTLYSCAYWVLWFVRYIE